MFIQFFYNLSCFIGILSVLLKLLSIQPIIRLALLIKIFIKSAFIFLLLDYYFLGLTYIIVYVGAIAILFLFVIKMASSGLDHSTKNISQYTLLAKAGIGLAGFLKEKKESDILNGIPLEKEGNICNYFIIDYSSTWLSFTDIQSFGFLLYLAFPFITILFGILLWCVLIGIIIVST